MDKFWDWNYGMIQVLSNIWILIRECEIKFSSKGNAGNWMEATFKSIIRSNTLIIYFYFAMDNENIFLRAHYVWDKSLKGSFTFQCKKEERRLLRNFLNWYLKQNGGKVQTRLNWLMKFHFES